MVSDFLFLTTIFPKSKPEIIVDYFRFFFWCGGEGGVR
jgi:hypothetical protein